MVCPICGSSKFGEVASCERIARELRQRDEFFAARTEGPPDEAEMKDRTDVVHKTAAKIHVCKSCGLFVRDDDGRGFASDRYAPYVMERMLRTYVDAFRHKERLYRPLLPQGARVLEIGSYVGGFLHVASEWGWNAIGVDVGEDTAAFACAHGYHTRKATLEECAFEDASFDGVFIWNTFEQLEAPQDVIAEVRRIVRDVVVIRTPSAHFYATTDSPTLLGHANLLGFPHRYGYTTSTLDRLMTQHGFEVVAHYGDMHIPPSRSRLTATAKREEDEMRAALAERSDANDWPWWEGIYRISHFKVAPQC